MTEVHAMSAGSDYKKFILRTPTVLEESDINYAFAVTDARDLFVVKKRFTGTRSTEVHLIDLP
jgi:hypothetical protein